MRQNEPAPLLCRRELSPTREVGAYTRSWRLRAKLAPTRVLKNSPPAFYYFLELILRLSNFQLQRQRAVFKEVLGVNSRLGAPTQL
jgi:hypothetical protein